MTVINFLLGFAVVLLVWTAFKAGVKFGKYISKE